MGLAVVREVVNLEMIPPQGHPVVGIGQNRAHRPPGHRSGSQLLQAKVGHQLGHQGENRWGFRKQGVLQNTAATGNRAQGEADIAVAPEVIRDAQAAAVATGIGRRRQLNNRRQLGLHQIAAHLIRAVGQSAAVVLGR